MDLIKGKSSRTVIAESAIQQLKIGIERQHKGTILEAYDMVEDPNFSWDDLDVLFMEWDDLIDVSNDILLR